MTAFTYIQLRETHSNLLKKIDNATSNEERTNLVEDVLTFLKQIEQAGSDIGNDDERNSLLTYVRFWAAYVYDNTRTYPNVTLRPYDGVLLDSPEQKTVLNENDEQGIVDLGNVANEAANRSQEILRSEIDNVRLYIKSRKWREALVLAKIIEPRITVSLIEIFRDLFYQVQTGLNNELGGFLTQGNNSRSSGDLVAARNAYQAALNLDPTNSDAILALQEIYSFEQEQALAMQLKKLRASLNDRANIRRLGDAVIEAEAYDQEGKLPDELIILCKEARAFYNQTRLKMGVTTTKMRVSDVRTNLDAIKELETLIERGERDFYDANSGTFRPLFEVLDEARAHFQQVSEELIQHEIEIADNNKNMHPRWAFQRLAELLEQPFHEQSRRKVEEKFSEIKLILQLQEHAEILREGAFKENVPAKRLSLLIAARETYKNLFGVEEQIVQARSLVFAEIQTKVSDLLNNAEASLNTQDYQSAHNSIDQAVMFVNSWPEIQKPDEISELLKETQELSQKIVAAENINRSYIILAQEIRQKIVDQGQLDAGLALFKKVSEDDRFKKIFDLATLTSEVDQYRLLGDQLTDALTARSVGNWPRVFEISERVVLTGSAGHLAQQFQDIYTEAIVELNINRLQELLNSDDISEANIILSSLLNKDIDSDRKTNLLLRLSNEIELIQNAIHATPSIQPLYDKAISLLGLIGSVNFKNYIHPSFSYRRFNSEENNHIDSPEISKDFSNINQESDNNISPNQRLKKNIFDLLVSELTATGIVERLMALKLFRFVGGDRNQPREADWPHYALSLRTSESRRAAYLVVSSIRKDVLNPLKLACNEYRGRENELDDEILHQLAEQAAALREASVLESEIERSISRWAEVQWGLRHARVEEKQGNWSVALEIWNDLDSHFPGIQDIKWGLRNARIHNTIDIVHNLQNDHNYEDALNLLREIQSKIGMGISWELSFALAEAYELMEQYSYALRNIEQAERTINANAGSVPEDISTQLHTKREEIESRQLIADILQNAKREVRAGNPNVALQMIQSGMLDPKVKDLSLLQQLQHEIFSRTSDELLQKIHAGLDHAGNADRFSAIMVLLDLISLEDVIKQPIEIRRSSNYLTSLGAEMPKLAARVIQTAKDFYPSNTPLKDSINQAVQLYSRLQIIKNFIPFLKPDLDEKLVVLDDYSTNIATILRNMQELENVLQQGSDKSLWELAIHAGDFRNLEWHLANMHELDNGHNWPEVHSFEERLGETKEIYTHLMEAMGDIEQKFAKDEDFNEVTNIITNNLHRPQQRANGISWRYIQGQGYEEILDLLDDRLQLPDYFGGEYLIGWRIVFEEAKERAHEIDYLLKRENQCANMMQTFYQYIEKAELQSNEPHRFRKMSWEKVRDASQSVIGKLTELWNVKARSHKAENIQKKGKEWKLIAEKGLLEAETQISTLNEILSKGGFPTPKDYADAVAQNDWNRLGKLLTRDREAGITNDEERKRVSVYENLLKKQLEKKRNWWKF